MSDPDDRSHDARLDALEERLAKARGAPAKPHTEEHYSQANLAWRMVIELVAGLMIGAGIGYGIDTLAGTMPIFLVLFLFLGLAAGVKTMLRSAKEVQLKREAEVARGKEGQDGRNGT
ncbi:AtpZ/AtpI family protein [Rubellimicrobium arenae]|uniref:AtpZ/AtpI family protein n=1 Tax=Rubellimicrobium arenae TaxID=2817372 RepID=UPI001B3155E9|nr:AtpZ/AtpI family protein [Rubellimicrobium arenae]